MIQAVDLVKSYGSGTNKQVVLKKVCLEIVPGDFTVILGASGSGKSTSSPGWNGQTAEP